MFAIPVTRGVGRRIGVQGQSGQKLRDPISKLTKVKRVGGVAQVVEHLPSKCAAQSSNPNTARGKKRKPTSNFSISVMKSYIKINIPNQICFQPPEITTQ
jgi:hypothetical protein